MNNPLSGKLESGYGVPGRLRAASILRRYEFYAFNGMYKRQTHEARFKPDLAIQIRVQNDIGTYLGSQNAAANILPEPRLQVLLIVLLFQE